MLTKYNNALYDLRELQEELDEHANAHLVLDDVANHHKFATMAEKLETAIEDIRAFVSNEIAPKSKDCDVNIIEQ
jgi:hypothetical protein